MSSDCYVTCCDRDCQHEPFNDYGAKGCCMEHEPGGVSCFERRYPGLDRPAAGCCTYQDVYGRCQEQAYSALMPFCSMYHAKMNAARKQYPPSNKRLTVEQTLERTADQRRAIFAFEKKERAAGAPPQVAMPPPGLAAPSPAAQVATPPPAPPASAALPPTVQEESQTSPAAAQPPTRGCVIQ